MVAGADTLISLSRLADRELITESEHWQLSDAYNFCARSNTAYKWNMGCRLIRSPVSRRDANWLRSG